MEAAAAFSVGGGGGGGEGGGGWLAVAGLELRRQVVDTMVRKLALIYRGQFACRQALHIYATNIAANLEARIFSQTRSMDEYMRTISLNIANLGRSQPASVRQHQMQMQLQMGQQMLPVHPVQAVQGGNSWVPVMPQAASNIAVPTRIPSQLQGMINAMQGQSESMLQGQQMQMGQQMLPAHPVQAVQVGNSWVPAMPQAASNIAGRIPSQLEGMINVRQEQSEPMPMPDQIPNSQPGAIAPSSPNSEGGNQPDQRVVQSEGTQSQAQGNPASAMLQNAATVGPNSQQIPLLRQNAGGISTHPVLPFQVQQQQREQMLMWRHNQQGLGANQHHLQMHQTHPAQQSNVAGMQIGGHPGGQNNQQQISMFPPNPMTLSPLQIAVDQQSNSSFLNPQTPTTVESVGVVDSLDWREELFQKISSLKDANCSELMELHSSLVHPNKTDEELESLPKQQADLYRFSAKVKARTRTALNFLQIQKDQINECTKERLCKQESSINDLIDFRRKRKAMIAEMNGRHQSQEYHADDDNPAGQADENEVALHDYIEAELSKKRPFDTLTDEATSLPQEELCSAAFLVWLQEQGDGPTPASGMMGSRCITVEPESTPRSSTKRQKADNGDSALLREMKAINDKLIDTLITVTGDGGEDGGTTSIIEFTYTAVALAPDMKQLITSNPGTSLVKQAKLSVPADYPRSSPVLLDDEPPRQQGMCGEVAGLADVAFQRALGELPEPKSIEQMARSWDASVRGAVTEFARRRGGGTFSSAYGRWESCSYG